MQTTFETEMVHGLGAAQMIVLGRGRGRGLVDAGGYSREPEWRVVFRLESGEEQWGKSAPVSYCATQIAVQQLFAVVEHTRWEDPEYAELGKPEVRSHSCSQKTRMREVTCAEEQL